MKKVFNWLKKDDNFWLMLVILGILAIIIGVVFFWDWMWKYIYIWIVIYLIFSFFGGGSDEWKKYHGLK